VLCVVLQYEGQLRGWNHGWDYTYAGMPEPKVYELERAVGFEPTHCLDDRTAMRAASSGKSVSANVISLPRKHIRRPSSATWNRNQL